MQTIKGPSESHPSPDTARMVREAVRTERERMAKILHDTVCQDLTGGYLMVYVTAMQCQKVAPELEQKLNAVAVRLQAAGETLRQLLRSLQSEEQQGGNDS